MAERVSSSEVRSWVSALLSLGVLLSLLLSLAPEAERAGEPERSWLRARLAAASAAAEQGPAFVLLGDAQLSMAIGTHLDAEREPGHGDTLLPLSYPGLGPVDALALLRTLDELDPRGQVELVLELDLRDFAGAKALMEDCALAAACELTPSRPGADAGPLAAGWHDLSVAGGRGGELLARAFVGWRGSAPAQAERSALNSEAYADLRTQGEHVSLRALEQLLERLERRGRSATLFFPPLSDALTEEVGAARLGAQISALTSFIHARAGARVRVLDLDHPLFSAGYFHAEGEAEQGRLRDEGQRVLAINLLHELGLPLARRPYEWMMVHPEGFDRSLVHRVEPGAGEGGATAASFTRPEGVAVDRSGGRIVVADTGNHVLRELRGSKQIVETVAGELGEAGELDGLARGEARLSSPRGPSLRPAPEAVPGELWFIDGEARERVRVYAGGQVHTPAWIGPSCAAYRQLRAREDAIWMLCEDSRLLRLMPERGQAWQVSDVSMDPLVSFDLGPSDAYFADINGSLWSRQLRGSGDQVMLGRWKALFRNTGGRFLPTGRKVTYPYHYDDIRLAKVVDLHYVERYGGLLVADEFPPLRGGERLGEQWTERVQLRFFDLEVGRILPWIKALVHGEAHATYNETTYQFASYFHQGSMALAQDDASLVWLESGRSRLIQVADGMLGVGKSGNHHTAMITIPKFQTLAGVGRMVAAQMRPDRFLDSRAEPLPRSGPFVAVLFGSSLSSMGDRYSNYSLGRRTELELQRELGYREGMRVDLFQVSWPAANFAEGINNFNNWMATSVPPDLVLIEAQDFGSKYLEDTPEPADVAEAFAKLQRLADRYGTLVAFYDISSIEANRRDSMRSTDKDTAELLDQARELGFVVLDLGDELLPRLLQHSPWGCQPFADNQHHGSTWSIDFTAQLMAAKLAPILRERWTGATPVRWAERPPKEFMKREAKPLAGALEAFEFDEDALLQVAPAYIQTNYVDGELFVYVDLAGFGESVLGDRVELLAVSVIARVLGNDVYAELAQHLSLELVEFSNYDEYGNGVLDSADTVWRRRFDRESLAEFLQANAP